MLLLMKSIIPIDEVTEPPTTIIVCIKDCSTINALIMAKTKKTHHNVAITMDVANFAFGAMAVDAYMAK